MSDRKIQGKCISCRSRFPIDIEEFEDYMLCPNCNEDANITAICPHCGQNIDTNGRTIGTQEACLTCDKDFIWNTVLATDGKPLIISTTGRVELHDLAAMLSVMQQQIGEEKSNKKDDSPNNSKGCLGSILFVVFAGAGLTYYLSKLIG